MRQDDGYPANFPPTLNRARQIVMTGEMVADADDRKRSPPHRLVVEDHDARFGQRGANRGCSRPMVVIAKYSEDTEPSAQTSKWCGQANRPATGARRVVASDEVASDKNHVRAQRVDLIDDGSEPARLHAAIAKMNVGQQGDPNGG